MRPFSVDVSESIRFGFRSLTSRPVDFLKQASLPLAVLGMAGIAFLRIMPAFPAPGIGKPGAGPVPFPPFGVILCIVVATFAATAFFSMTWLQQAADEKVQPQRFGAYLLTGVLVSLAVSASLAVSVIAVSAVTGSGFPSFVAFAAAVVANIALYLRLAFAPVAAALGDGDPIRRSWDLTRGRTLRILCSAAVLGFIGYVAAAFLAPVGMLSPLLAAALGSLLNLAVMALQHSTVLYLYRSAQTEIIY